jgi:hypothetical protein
MRSRSAGSAYTTPRGSSVRPISRCAEYFVPLTRCDAAVIMFVVLTVPNKDPAFHPRAADRPMGMAIPASTDDRRRGWKPERFLE